MGNYLRWKWNAIFFPVLAVGCVCVCGCDYIWWNLSVKRVQAISLSSTCDIYLVSFDHLATLWCVHFLSANTDGNVTYFRMGLPLSLLMRRNACVPIFAVNAKYSVQTRSTEYARLNFATVYFYVVRNLEGNPFANTLARLYVTFIDRIQQIAREKSVPFPIAIRLTQATSSVYSFRMVASLHIEFPSPDTLMLFLNTDNGNTWVWHLNFPPAGMCGEKNKKIFVIYRSQFSIHRYVRLLCNCIFEFMMITTHITTHTQHILLNRYI